MKIKLHSKHGRVAFSVIECVIAILVVVVAGIAVVKIVRYCKKYLAPAPPPSQGTNAPPTNVVSNFSVDTNTFAAYFFLGTGESFPDSSSTNCDCGNSIDLEYTITETDRGPKLQLKCLGPSALVSSNEFMRSLVPYGLDITNLYETYYGSNGSPVAANYLQFTNGVLRVTEETTGVYTAVIERTGDLYASPVVWVSVITNVSSVGQIVRLTDSDAPYTKGFYRGAILYTNQ